METNHLMMRNKTPPNLIHKHWRLQTVTLLGNITPQITCPLRRTHSGQNTLCPYRSLSEPKHVILKSFTIGTLYAHGERRKRCLLLASPEDFACATLIVPAGGCPGAIRRTPPRRAAGAIGVAFEAPRRPAVDGGPAQG